MIKHKMASFASSHQTVELYWIYQTIIERLFRTIYEFV